MTNNPAAERAPTADPNTQIELRQAARALGNAGLVHAYGHCSVRLDEQYFLVCAPEPMATLAPGEDGNVVAIKGELPAGVLGEVRIHQHIYRLNPTTRAVCRIMPPSIMTLSTQRLTPRARHGLAAYFGDHIPLWEDPRLLRNDGEAERLAQQMAAHPAIVMRGNGAVVQGQSLYQAVAYCWYLEDSARVELAVRNSGLDPDQGLLSATELTDRQVFSGRVFERMWRHLTHNDPERCTPEKTVDL
ncbi:MAG: class II aldolase/adducin family protein [Gammaproteobacteria bacterium]|nr:class II aldolase/adducin family protein [Gammaproteobacteria bacterium]